MKMKTNLDHDFSIYLQEKQQYRMLNSLKLVHL